VPRWLQTISRLTIIAELCRERERPTYVALTNMITSPFVLAGLAAGWAADRFGYEVIFIAAASVALAAALWLLALVRDPRADPAAGIP
jgi:MFS family permease